MNRKLYLTLSNFLFLTSYHFYFGSGAKEGDSSLSTATGSTGARTEPDSGTNREALRCHS
jgi:hypothetical protein